jgi:hypothetical protein
MLRGLSHTNNTVSEHDVSGEKLQESNMAAPNLEPEFKTQKPVKFKKWIPKKWRPEYERVVAMSAAGMSNKQIAASVGFTPVHVSNILNLPQATDLMERIVAKMREKSMVDIPSTLQRVAEKAAQRLESVINNDELFEKSPFAVLDRGMDVIKGLNHLKGGGNGAPGNVTHVHGNAMIVSSDQADALSEGLRKRNEVKRLHSPNEIVVEDANGSGSETNE